MSERDIVMYIVVRTDLNMSRGKIAAQVAHAAVSCYNADSVRALFGNTSHGGDWYKDFNQKKIVLAVESEEELMGILERARQIIGPPPLIACLIQDVGTTEIKEGTPTCLGLGPDYKNVASIPVKHLPLLK